MCDIKDVCGFWEDNPLFSGESSFEVGSKEYFEEHKKVIIEDGYAGEIDERMFPKNENRGHALDLGCGPGFWTTEFLLRGVVDKVTAGDLTIKAQELTKRRLEVYGLSAEVCYANAEDLTFEDNYFYHVNCTGVIHHTPNTEKCVSEIARVIRPGGSALISVYFKNAILKLWPIIYPVGSFLGKIGASLKGRGRESIYFQKDINEIVRMYDGSKNPIGKAYSKMEFMNMLKPHFEIEDVFYNFFPARSLPIKIPTLLHKMLDKQIPFMMNACLRKPQV